MFSSKLYILPTESYCFFIVDAEDAVFFNVFVQAHEKLLLWLTMDITV